jgi:hypothetical protein
LNELRMAGSREAIAASKIASDKDRQPNACDRDAVVLRHYFSEP